MGQLGRCQLAPGDLDFVLRGPGFGEGRADLVTSAVDRSRALGDRLPDLCVAFLDQGEIAGAEIEEGPVHAGIEISSAGEIADQRRNEITATAENATAEAQPESRKQGPADFLLLAGLRFADRRGPRRDVGPLAQGKLNQVLLGRCDRHEDERHQRPADRLKAHRGVKVEAVGEPGRRYGEVFLGFLNQGDPPFPLRQGTVGVRLPSFAGVSVVPGEPVHLLKLALGKALKVEDRLVAQQLEMEQGDVEQNIVRGCLRAETRAGDPLPRGQRLKPGVG